MSIMYFDASTQTYSLYFIKTMYKLFYLLPNPVYAFYRDNTG